jgi:hypothetical protein
MARYKPMDETWFMYEIDHKDVPIHKWTNYNNIPKINPLNSKT